MIIDRPSYTIRIEVKANWSDDKGFFKSLAHYEATLGDWQHEMAGYADKTDLLDALAAADIDPESLDKLEGVVDEFEAMIERVSGG